MGIADVFSSKNEKDAAQAQANGYSGGFNAAFNSLNKGLNDANTDYSSALGMFAPYAANYGNASSAYADALGLNGASGNANATNMFQASPGYQYSTDQAIQALERRASAQGQLGSGQTGLDTLASVYGLANNDYSSWLDRLNGLDTKGLTAAQSQSGIYGNMANADLATNAAIGGYGWDMNTGIGNAFSDYQKSKDQAGMNAIGTIAGALSLGAKALGLGGFGVPGGK